MKMNLAVSMAIGNPYVGFRPIIPGINAHLCTLVLWCFHG